MAKIRKTARVTDIAGHEISHFWQLIQGGLTKEAEKLARKLLIKSKGQGKPLHLLGAALLAQHRYEEALGCLQRSIRQLPNDAEVWDHWAVALASSAGESKDVLHAFDHSLKLNPNRPEVWLNAGKYALEQGDYATAETYTRETLRLHSRHGMAYNNLATILLATGRYEEAESAIQAALASNPELPEITLNQGTLLLFTGRIRDAIPVFERAVAQQPDLMGAHSNMLFAHSYLADQSPEFFVQAAQQFARKLDLAARPFSSWYSSVKDQHRPLRIGFVSGDLKNHPVGYFLEGVLRCIDTNKLQLLAYPTNRSEDLLTERIKPFFSAWNPIAGKPDKAAAEQIRNDQVDILIDLAGHSAYNRLALFAWKPAPVQVSWLGYFATTGLAAIDYILGDPWVTPQNETKHFVEQIWQLPETYLCFTPPEHSIPLPEVPPVCSSHVVTFGSFNNLMKLNDEVVELWANVLHAVPESQLFLKTAQLKNASVQEATRLRFAHHGIGTERLILEGPSTRFELLASYNRVDIALDPFPYPGGTTTAEALWMGVPVLTKQGDRFLSHVGESIAHNAGLSEWIAVDNDAYLQKAISFAADTAYLMRLRKELRTQVLSSALFDAPRFARHFEEALCSMWQGWAATWEDAEAVGQDTNPARPAPFNISDVFHNALKLHQKNNIEQAELFYQQILAVEPNHFDALHMSGLLHHEKNDHDMALAFMKKALAIRANNPVIWNNIGEVYRSLNRLPDAEKAYRRSLELAPDYPTPYSGLGIVLRGCGDLAGAEAAFRQAISMKPDNVATYSNLGNLLVELGKMDEAEFFYQKGLEVQPTSAELYTCIGNIKIIKNRLDDARNAFQHALGLNPNQAMAGNNLALIHALQGDLLEAENKFRKSLVVTPGYVEAFNNLLMYRNYVRLYSLPEIYQEHLSFGERFEAPLRSQWQAHSNLPEPGRCLRIGYVSADFCDHAASYFVESVVALHNRERFEVFCYYNRATGDAVTERFKTLADQWRPVAGMNDDVLADLIRQDGIDILVDLSGHTGHNRLLTFARKPAPVQVSWLGYFNTTGLTAMDWLIGDHITHPPELDQYYTEKIWRMDGTLCVYRPMLRKPERRTAPEYAVQPAPALAKGFVTFGCCNNYAKLSDAAIALWCRILHSVPASRLLLEVAGFAETGFQKQISARFATHGISSDRLLLLPRDASLQYLRYHEIDIALDPFPANGGTTTNDLLWMGVPLVTLRGDTFIGRLGASFVTAAGHPEWVAGNEEEYLQIAQRLASDPDRLNRIRMQLRQETEASSLMDEAGFVSKLEQAYRSMWSAWCEKQGVTVQSTAELLKQALEKHQTGCWTEAEALYRQILMFEPLHFDALHMLGVLLHQSNRPHLAIQTLEQALKLNQKYPAAWFHMAEICTVVGQQDNAIACYKNAVALDPKFDVAWQRLGKLLQAIGRLPEAANCYQHALAINPGLSDVANTFAVVLIQLGQLQAAENVLKQAIHLKPDYAEAYNNLGNVLQGQNRLAEAIEAIQKSLALRPDNAYANSNLGALLKNLGRLPEAEALLRKAVSLKPDLAVAWNNLGTVLYSLGRHPEAEAVYRHTIKLQSDYGEAYNNLGFVRQFFGCLDEAVAFYRKTLELMPAHSFAYGNLLLCFNYLSYSLSEIYQEHLSFGERFEAPLRSQWQAHSNLPEPGRCLKLGYVSADFCDHAASYFVESVVALHNRERFEVFCYYNRATGDAVTERFKTLADQWRPVAGMNDDVLAGLIRQDGIDILVDLSGHTGHNRLLTFARKPAPVQVSWLGYFNTTGLTAMDWLIGDHITHPPELDQYYTEKIWRMDGTLCVYRPMLRKPERRTAPEYAVQPAPALTKGFVTFGCCNNYAKLSDAAIALWCRILHSVPASRLLLEVAGFAETGFQKQISARFATHGISSDRLLLLPRDTSLQYLRYHEIDIALDPFPANGGTTTCDLLWMGVPLVTLKGATFIGRTGASFVTSVGHPEWVAGNEEEYLQIAQRLASDPDRLNRIRMQLRQETEASSLMDEAGFVSKLEQAYRSMWSVWCEKQG